MIAALLLIQALDTAHPQPDVGPLDRGRPLAVADSALSNGVRVTFVPFGASPKTLVRVVIVTGDACGAPAVLAHAFETAGRPLTDSIAHMGGALTVSVRPERIDLSVDVLSPFAPAAIALLSRVVRSPSLEAATLDQSPTASDLDSLATATFQAAVFPAGQFGSCAHPDRITTSSPAVGPRSTRVIVVGRFDTPSVLSAIATAFGEWSATAAPVPFAAASPASPSLTFVHRQGARQVALIVGAPTPGPADSDFAKLHVMNTLLGGGIVSRITKNIREAKGYAYGPSSALVTAPSGAAYWAEAADVAAPVAQPALQQIVAEITRLGDAAPDMAEVEGAERYLIGRSLFNTSTRLGLADAAEEGTTMRDVPGATGADVQRLAHAYLAPGRLTIVVVGDTLALGSGMAAIRAVIPR
jgi:zinc protease